MSKDVQKTKEDTSKENVKDKETLEAKETKLEAKSEDVKEASADKKE